jgi:protein CASC3
MSETALVEEPAVEEETPPKPIVIAKNPVPIEDPKKKIRKKLWNESDRWGHDLFNENEQIPKSKDELVDIYGYDIRNEDDPPKARRRRRYGRGPNKYTRQWQDENAYGKAMPPNIEHNRSFRNDNNDRNERNANSRNDRSANERIDRERQYNRKERNKTDRKEKFSNDLSDKKAVKSNDKPVNDKKKFDSEDKIMKRVQPFSTDEFPELPNNDLRKKITSNTSSQHQEVWKNRNSSEVEDKHEKEFKTEPMKIIEAIENSNRSSNFNEVNAPNIVRTQTFENSKYSQRRSSANFDYEEDDRKGVRGRNRPNNESTGRAIKKTNNNLNYSNYNHGREVPTDNYRNRNMGRSERSFHEESNRNIERYYEEDTYRSQREGSNYVSEANTGLQKITIEDKTPAMSRNNESEVPRTKRYSSLRQQQQQQQQRVMPENIPNISTNSQLTQGSDGRNLSAHQYYDSHPIQTAPYFPEPSTPRNTYPTYMSTNTTESPPQTHPSNYLPQQLTQRYITQATVPPTPESSRYLPPNVSPNVVTASVPTAMPSIPQTGPPLPPTVMSAVAPPPPPGATYIPSFPSGYPQYPPPTHVPPGYPGHVPQQPQPPTPLQMSELYRGGVTYYDTQSQQQHTIRQIPQRRPKAAIPIIPPSQGRDDPNASGDQSYGDGDKSYVSVNS